jgi:hypothetical protein
MKRRQLLKLVPPALASSLTGCTGDDTDEPAQNNGDGNDGGDTPTQEGTPEPRSIGQTLTYGGLEMAVTQTQVTNEIVTADGSDMGEERDNITPEEGAVFALAYLRIKNVGDTEIFYPERGGDVQMVYRGEETSDEFVTGPLGGIDSDKEQVYSDSMNEKGADAGAYPDTVVEGWAVFELPEGFEQSDAFVTIRYSDTSADSRTFRWRFGQ